jgi:ubiquinone/menaquinone biosynthesis C-methylase UbiE
VSGYDVAADFGLLYDAMPVYAGRADVGFYVDEASRAGPGSTVLELGCGTGRITIPLARAGHTVLGVDASPAMLARARAKLAAEPEDVRRRVTLREADARALAIPNASCDCVFATFRMLQHLTTVEDQLRCLAASRRCLAPGGKLAFDVFNPSYAVMLRDRSGETEDTPEQALPDGRFVRRTVRVVGVHWHAQLSEIELIYHVRHATETQRVVHAFDMRWYTALELQHLLARSGFRVESLFGTFDRQPLRDDSSEIVVVAAAIG